MIDYSKSHRGFIAKVSAQLEALGRCPKRKGRAVTWQGPSGQTHCVFVAALSGFPKLVRIRIERPRILEWTALPRELDGLVLGVIEAAEIGAGLHRFSRGSVIRKSPNYLWSRSSDEDESHCEYYVTENAAKFANMPIVD